MELMEVVCLGYGGADGGRGWVLGVWDSADRSTLFQVLGTHFVVLQR